MRSKTFVRYRCTQLLDAYKSNKLNFNISPDCNLQVISLDKVKSKFYSETPDRRKASLMYIKQKLKQHTGYKKRNIRNHDNIQSMEVKPLPNINREASEIYNDQINTTLSFEH